MVYVGSLAVVFFLATAVVGYFGSRGLLVQRVHLLGGLVATLLQVFAQSWLAIYFIGVAALLRDGGQESLALLLRRPQRLASLALLVSVGNFVVGGLRLGGDFETGVHVATVLVCLVVQIMALGLEWTGINHARDGIALVRAGKIRGAED